MQLSYRTGVNIKVESLFCKCHGDDNKMLPKYTCGGV